MAKGLVKPFNRIPTLIVLGLALAALTAVGIKIMGGNVGKYIMAFLVVFALCLLANILGNQKGMRHYGINAEIWSIALGMLIANTVGTPKWLKDGALVEYFIKTGLVLLGAEVLFHKILAIGIPGIFVAWVVTPHRCYQHIYLRSESAENALEDIEHRHLSGHVRVRHFSGHRHSGGGARQKGGADPLNRLVSDIHGHHDDRHARVYQLGGHA